jgi:hypothetical protein
MPNFDPLNEFQHIGRIKLKRDHEYTKHEQ